MRANYWLPPRKAFFCRLAGRLFQLSAAVMLLGVAFSALTPGADPYCEVVCSWNMRPTSLLDRDVRLQVEATPAAMRVFDKHVARPIVRLGLAAADALDSLPFGFLLFCVGMALRQLGARDGDALERALLWLRRASLAAIVWTALKPFHDSAVEAVLSPGTPGGASIQLAIYLGDIASRLLLAAAAYASIWALEAGLRAQRDLESFV